MKLDIACGQAKKEGFLGVDVAEMEGVDFVHDLLSFPWPFGDASVSEACCHHFLEHVPKDLRPAFMRELHRVLAPGAACTFATPLGIWRQCQDPTHEWPPIVPGSYMYFSHAWLEQHGLSHYIDALGLPDFEVEILGLAMDEGHAGLSGDDAARAAKYTQNAADDLVVRLTRRA